MRNLQEVRSVDAGVNLVEMAEQLRNQSEVIYESVKYVEEVGREVKKSEEATRKVGEFMVGFYNEYVNHDKLTRAQAKDLQKAQNKVTTEITKILNPSLSESNTRGSAYLKEWIKVNKGIWSIWKHNVNGSKYPYYETPKYRFEQGLEYMESLTVADYLAYRDGRWGDIRKFEFDDSKIRGRITLDDIVESSDKTMV